MGVLNQVDVSDVHELYEQNLAVIIDVREDHEVTAQHIPNSIHIAMSAFNPDQIPVLESGQKLFFICAAGIRSNNVAQHLVDNGYLKEAGNIMGGMSAWNAAGFITK